MEHYMRSLAKLLASVILLGALLLTIAFSLALVPLSLAGRFSGRGKSSTILEIAPMTILGGLLWKLWSPAVEEAKTRAKTRRIPAESFYPSDYSDLQRRFGKRLYPDPPASHLSTMDDIPY